MFIIQELPLTIFATPQVAKSLAPQPQAIAQQQQTRLQDTWFAQAQAPLPEANILQKIIMLVAAMDLQARTQVLRLVSMIRYALDTLFLAMAVGFANGEVRAGLPESFSKVQADWRVLLPRLQRANRPKIGFKLLVYTILS